MEDQEKQMQTQRFAAAFEQQLSRAVRVVIGPGQDQCKDDKGQNDSGDDDGSFRWHATRSSPRTA
jgi:hypothetical protein